MTKNVVITAQTGWQGQSAVCQQMIVEGIDDTLAHSQLNQVLVKRLAEMKLPGLVQWWWDFVRE